MWKICGKFVGKLRKTLREIAGKLRKICGKIVENCGKLCKNCGKIVGKMRKTWREIAGELRKICGNCRKLRKTVAINSPPAFQNLDVLNLEAFQRLGPPPAPFIPLPSMRASPRTGQALGRPHEAAVHHSPPEGLHVRPRLSPGHLGRDGGGGRNQCAANGRAGNRPICAPQHAGLPLRGFGQGEGGKTIWFTWGVRFSARGVF